MFVELSIATAPLWVVAALVARWEYLRKKHYEANVSRGEAAIADAQAEVLREQARTLRIRNDFAERRQLLDPKALAGYVIDTVRATLPSDTAAPPTVDSNAMDRVAELADKQLMPDVENFLEPPIVNVEIETAGDGPPLPDDDADPASTDVDSGHNES
jgi:hypothetical protein